MWIPITFLGIYNLILLYLMNAALYSFSIGYLLCIFEDKLDETTLEKLQDFEFAVSRWLEREFIVLVT